MKPYLISLAAGLLVGGIYSILSVRSPAPPAIALIGLLGILLGEQVVPLVRTALFPPAIGHELSTTTAHLFGRLPGHNSDRSARS